MIRTGWIEVRKKMHQAKAEDYPNATIYNKHKCIVFNKKMFGLVRDVERFMIELVDGVAVLIPSKTEGCRISKSGPQPRLNLATVMEKLGLPDGKYRVEIGDKFLYIDLNNPRPKHEHEVLHFETVAEKYVFNKYATLYGKGWEDFI